MLQKCLTISYVCNSIKDCYFDEYVSDNKSNNDVLDSVLADRGIKLIIAPTGGGKSTALLDRAEELVAKDKDYRIVFCLPAKMLTLQMGNRDSVYSMTGGDMFDETSPLIATTYEKMFAVKSHIELKETPVHLNRTGMKKNVLVLDESHLLTTQHMFRQTAIKSIISCIEKNYFHSVVLVTATPAPMSLFRCDEIVEFLRKKPLPSMDKLEIIAVDDVGEYIKNIDYGSEFPFIRLNKIDEIDNLIAQMPQTLARLTKDDKGTKAYQDIVNDGKIDSTGISGILSTCVVEAGVNITDYPDNIIPTAVFMDNNISVDSIEQFLNRFRRTSNKHVKCARVIVKKPKQKEIKVSLLSCNNDMLLCEFQDIHMEMGNLTINDTGLMDSVEDGKYKLKFEMGSSIFYRYITIASSGVTDKHKYIRNSTVPIVFDGMGFRSFIKIFGENFKNAEELESINKELQDIYEQRRQELNLSDDELDREKVRNDVTIGQLIRGYIREDGELGDCLSYDDREVVIDKRICYEIAYHQFNRQYYHNHDILAKELEKRLCIKAEFMEQDTAKGKRTVHNEDDIWENLEDLRQYIVVNGDDIFWRSLMGYNDYFYCYSKKKEVFEIREQEHIIEQLKILEKVGITGTTALKVITSSKSIKKIKEYTDSFHIIVYNRFLKQCSGMDISELPSYKGKKKLSMRQTAIYYCLKEKGQVSYSVTKNLAEEIIAFYKKAYPKDTKAPTVGAINKMVRKMYKSKGKDIRNILRTEENEILKLVTSDYQ